MIQEGIVRQLEGVFVPMFTPFAKSARDLNEAQLRANTRFLIDSGIKLINPVGTTGEFWTLSLDEHKRAIKAVLEEANASDAHVLVIPGVTSPNLNTTLELVRYAEDCHAEMVQLAPPYFLPCSEEDLVAFYKAVSDQTNAAIMLYEMPPATGVYLRGDLLAAICDACPNVVAIKTAAAADSPREFERLCRRFADRLRIFSGTGTYFSPFTYMSGVHGMTDTLGNVAPKFGLLLHDLARSGQWLEMNKLYQDAFEVLEIELLYGRAGLKEIGNTCGFCVGPTRFPLVQSLTQVQLEDIRSRLSNWVFTRHLLDGERKEAQSQRVEAN